MKLVMFALLFTGVAAAEGLADETASLPRSLAEVPEAETGAPSLPALGLQDPEGHVSEFSLGPVAGYIRARDADRGTWFGGVQARYRFLRFLAVEGAITFHRDEFQDGDIEVTQYPVQVTGLLFPFPRSPLEPYGLVGAGWYYTRVDFDGSLGGGDDTDRLFGVHLGAGAQLEVGPRFAAFADFRWIFMDEPGVDNGDLDEEEFDSWQVSLGGSFRF